MLCDQIWGSHLRYKTTNKCLNVCQWLEMGKRNEDVSAIEEWRCTLLYISILERKAKYSEKDSYR